MTFRSEPFRRVNFNLPHTPGGGHIVISRNKSILAYSFAVYDVYVLSTRDKMTEPHLRPDCCAKSLIFHVSYRRKVERFSRLRSEFENATVIVLIPADVCNNIAVSLINQSITIFYIFLLEYDQDRVNTSKI